MNLEFSKKLPVPQQVKNRYPVTEELKAIKERRDREIAAVFEGKSDKFILVIGPCSAESHEPVLEYISRLRRVADSLPNGRQPQRMRVNPKGNGGYRDKAFHPHR